MDIVIHSLGMPFDGNTIKTKSLGGSETAAYYQARELAKLGHRVIVFSNCAQPMEADGVQYVPVGAVTEQSPLGQAFDHYATYTPIDVLIIQRHPLAFHKRYNSRVNVWQLHDLALYRTAGAVQGMLQNITFVTVVSEWHKEQVCKVYGLNPERVRVVRNGVDAALYDGNEDVTGDYEAQSIAPDKFVMLYQSRPERGLEHLVRPGGIMDRLHDTRAHLLVCGYENTTEQMAPYYDQLNQWAKALPNVTNVGALTKPQLAALQKSCDLLCYPTEFEEVSCITAMEAMHAGLPMITSDVGALKETCEGAGVQLIALKDGKADEDGFVREVENILNQTCPIDGESYATNDNRNKQLAAAARYTWHAAVETLAAFLSAELHTGNASAVIRNAIDHSDIPAAESVLASVESKDAISRACAEEIETLYEFRKSPESYAKHYALHQSLYYDSFEERVIGEDVTSTARFRGVMQILGSRLAQNPGYRYRVLDYGCAHGHYLIPLAKMFPHCEFIGVDISSRAVKACQTWITREGLDNCMVMQGSQEILNKNSILANNGPFDAVLAGEVVEHVADDVGLLNKLAGMLTDHGLLCVTTPHGRWEWNGTEAFRTGREHLHHYEREQILEMCAGHYKTETLYAPAGPDQAGGSLGSWLWGVSVNSAAKFKPRTLTTKSPRQTVSACLIVKDGEKTIRKCVESFIDVVDEVVIAIDPSTKDRTRQIIDSIKIDFPRKPFTILNGLKATEDGFDEARNRTVDAACGDWILWCDADEEIQNPWNLWQYLRPSMINAVGLPQVHYSMDPPRVLTTDYPCRLFRRGAARFYGVVHEHPESAPGEGISYSAMRGDVTFLHNGYINEAVRRQRFVRNLPLLARDREKYPNRKLNKFLMVRDIAQGIQFEIEQTGGQLLADHPDRALRGIDIWREMLKVDPVKMCVDALQYYSICVQASGGGFDSQFVFSTSTPVAPDRSVRMEVSGKFKNAADLEALHSKLLKEATSTYDERYL